MSVRVGSFWPGLHRPHTDLDLISPATPALKPSQADTHPHLPSASLPSHTLRLRSQADSSQGCLVGIYPISLASTRDRSELGFFKEKTFSTILNFQESCKHSTRNSHIAFTPIGLSFTFYPIYLSTTPPPHRFSRLLHFTVNSPGYLIKLKPVLSPLIAPITNHTYLFADFSSCFPPARMSAPRRQPCHCHTPTTVRAHEINA